MARTAARSDARKVADCRQFPSDKNCSVTIAGSESEVLKIAVRHAIEEHGHKNSPKLKEQVRSMLRDE